MMKLIAVGFSRDEDPEAAYFLAKAYIALCKWNKAMTSENSLRREQVSWTPSHL